MMGAVSVIMGSLSKGGSQFHACRFKHKSRCSIFPKVLGPPVAAVFDPCLRSYLQL